MQPTAETIQRPGAPAYVGLALVTLATLMYEILLTRIFSVTMWYHFAFVAISIAMFGMTVGAMVVYLAPSVFTRPRAKAHMAAAALLFALTAVGALLIHMRLPFEGPVSPIAFAVMAVTYAVISVPFVFSGICVCLALTRFPAEVSRLYAADLAGAAAGCILLACTLELTDAPTAVFVVAAVAAAGSFLFARGAGAAGLKRAGFVAVCFLGMFAAGHSVLVARQASLLRLPYVKGRRTQTPLYEKWNSFSRIAVYGNPEVDLQPEAWGLSRVYPGDRKIRQLAMDIDASARTVLLHFRGDLDAVDHLKYDVVNIAHYVRRGSPVLVIGSGGGRDILAALEFGQPSVTGVEINEDIIKTVNGVFGDFTGHLDRNPRVRFVADEARSWLARQQERFGIIQISLIDTWASTAAGAFVLSEHGLYTREAWQQFLERLTPDGVLTISRWHLPQRPVETLRLVALANAALRHEGAARPRDHIVLVTAPGGTPGGPGIGTILVGRAPFSPRDLDTIERTAARMRFKVFLSPRTPDDSLAATVASARDVGAAVAGYRFDITPPTDDSPFFFHTLRFRDLLRRQAWEKGLGGPRNAMLVLPVLLGIIVALSLVCVGLPLRLAAERPPARVALPLFVYFAAIGAGFMLVEVSQMQRLIVFLGHPTYALSVVLFSLLLFCGIGSYATRLVRGPRASARATWFLAGLLIVLMLFGALTPQAIAAFRASPTPLRILIAVALLSPIGLVMGTAFPIGMKAAAARSALLTPWLWGVNGATSVCASVVAVIIALSAGINASFWTGVACYAAAAAAFAWESSRER